MQIKDENFTVSFLHKNLDSVNLTFYYAFTFPYTYTDLQTFLEKLDEKYVLRAIDLKINLCKKFELEKNTKKSQEDIDTLSSINRDIENFQTIMTEASKIAAEECAKEISKTNAEPDLRIEGINDEFILENNVTNDILDDIYYYRELLINSIEDRRIDLLTISSFHGVQHTREDRLQHLFPDKSQQRCHTFKHKKVF